MSNQQQGSNEAPKTPAPGETKPAPQQDQGNRETNPRKILRSRSNPPFRADGEPGIVPGFFVLGRRR